MEKPKTERFKIRPAAPEDASAITSLCEQLGYPSEVGEVSARLSHILGDDEHGVFVAELDSGQIVGWIHVHIYRLFYAELMAEIAGLVVCQDFRRIGIGKQLLLKAEEWAGSKGSSAVNLRSNIVRKDAHLFYENLGYQKIKTQYTFRKIL